MDAAAGPYGEELEYLEDVLSLLTLRLHREVLVTRALRGDTRQESFLGLFLSEQDVDAILSELHGADAPVPDGVGALDLRIEALKDHIAARVARTGRALPPQRLSEVFDLGNPEIDLVLYLLAAEVDDRFGRVYGYLHDDVGRKQLSPGLAYRLMEEGPGSLADFRGLLHPSAPLVRERVVVFTDPEGSGRTPLMERPMRIEDRVADFLLGRDDLDPALVGVVERWEGEREEAYASAATRVAGAVGGKGGAVALTLHRDADADLWVGTLASSLDRSVLSLDWRRLATMDRTRFRSVVDRAVREARLQGAVLHVHHLEGGEPWQLHEVAGTLRGLVCLSSRSEHPWEERGLEALDVRVPALGREARVRRWTEALAAHLPDPTSNGVRGAARGLATMYPFTVRDMRDAVRGAPGRAAARDAGELAGEVAESCKRLASRRMRGAAQKVTTSFGFDDLVLPEATMDLLRELILYERHGPTVLDDWGLGRRFHQGEGSSALFMGPSGTGKTMAASVVANELGLELFRVDLSGVVSKYIGETEKNLDRVFDAASRSRVVLFIDEADALFGKRSEVTDAHDRYANIEVSYLLQRMESYDGIAILATNLGQNMDDAFVRRIRSVIEFPMPQASSRLRLWERLTTSQAPVGDDVDLELLAQRFELSGGHIRNCIVNGALYAAAEDDDVAMEHLMRAVGREYAKMGRPISRDLFGSWYTVVRRSGVT